MQDFKEMTVGMIIGTIITYNNLNMSEEEKKESEVREARQEDFDNF